MKKYKCNTILTSDEVISSIRYSSGYPIHVNEKDYEQFDVGDKVIFINSTFDKLNLMGTIRRKDQYPRKKFRQNGSYVEYTFTITFDAKVILKLDNE